MGNRVTKTEHAGPKKGVGAFYGRKRWAKRSAAVKRRQATRTVIEEQRRDADSSRPMRHIVVAPAAYTADSFRSLLPMPEVVSPQHVAASLTEHWSPRVVAEFDDSYVKVAKVHGTLAWHSHQNEDELFYVLRGSLTIEMEDRTVVLHEGEAFVVPKGVRHNPIAEHECHIMLIERKTTLHTGTEVTAKTRSVAEQLRPV